MTKEQLEKEAEEWLDDERKYIIEDDEGFLINIAKKVKEAYLAGAEPREKRIAELEAQIEKMKSQYDYAFTQLLESREIVCLMLSQYRNKKEINYSTRERGEKLLKQGVYKHD